MTMEVHSQGELSLVSGDPARVRQILNSLLSNAYNYTPDGGNILVKTSSEKSGDSDRCY